jgi:hypothetical protein
MHTLIRTMGCRCACMPTVTCGGAACMRARMGPQVRCMHPRPREQELLHVKGTGMTGDILHACKQWQVGGVHARWSEVLHALWPS